MRQVLIQTLIELAEKDDKVFLVSADMGFSVLEPFVERFPDRFLNSGITEQATMSLCAGLALSGFKVYAYSITPFITQRCFEQVKIDVAYMNTNVKIIGIGAGFEYGPAGATHHVLEDIAVMRSLPNMVVVCPGDNYEAKQIIEQSLAYKGPMYIRIGKNKEAFYYPEKPGIQIGKANIVYPGQDLAIISTSNTLGLAKAHRDLLIARGLNPMIVSMHTVKPIDREIIHYLLDKRLPIFTLEEHNIIGGLGSAVAEVIAESGKQAGFKRIGINDQYSHYVGNQDFQRNKFGLDNVDIYNLTVQSI